MVRNMHRSGNRICFSVAQPSSAKGCAWAGVLPFCGAGGLPLLRVGQRCFLLTSLSLPSRQKRRSRERLLANAIYILIKHMGLRCVTTRAHYGQHGPRNITICDDVYCGYDTLKATHPPPSPKHPLFPNSSICLYAYIYIYVYVL